MKCPIERASTGRKVQPCPEAVLEEGVWYVTFETLDEFNDFICDYGPLVVRGDYDGPDIVIYDAYLE